MQSAFRVTCAETRRPTVGAGTLHAVAFSFVVTSTGSFTEPSRHEIVSAVSAGTVRFLQSYVQSAFRETLSSTVAPLIRETSGTVAAPYAISFVTGRHAVPSFHVTLDDAGFPVTATVPDHVQSSFLLSETSTVLPLPRPGISGLVGEFWYDFTRVGLHVEPCVHSTTVSGEGSILSTSTS